MVLSFKVNKLNMIFCKFFVAINAQLFTGIPELLKVITSLWSSYYEAKQNGSVQISLLNSLSQAFIQPQ